jgi:hypothetical protein
MQLEQALPVHLRLRQWTQPMVQKLIADRLAIAVPNVFCHVHHDDGAEDGVPGSAGRRTMTPMRAAMERLPVFPERSRLAQVLELVPPAWALPFPVPSQSRQAARGPDLWPLLPVTFYVFSTYRASIYACQACNTPERSGAMRERAIW